MDQMLSEIRPTSIEESLRIRPERIDIGFDPNWMEQMSSTSVLWQKAAMAHSPTRRLVFELERQLFAKCIRDIFLVQIDTLIRDHFVSDYAHRLRENLNQEPDILFSRAFGTHFHSIRDIPDMIELRYDGYRLYYRQS